MYKKDSITLENVQRRATRLVNSLSGRTYADRLIILGLPTLEYRRLRANVIQVYKILNQIDRVDIDKFFNMSAAWRSSNLGHSLKWDPVFFFKPRCWCVELSTKLSSDGTFTELVRIKA